MPETQIKWEGAGTKLPDGHTVIETYDNEHRWAIFDQGGSKPEETDDGIIWLDPSRCLNAQTNHPPTIPVINDDGKRLTAA